MTKRNKIVLISAAAALLLGGIVKAGALSAVPESFWKALAHEVGPSFAHSLESALHSGSVSAPEVSLGASGDTYNTARLVQVNIVTTTEALAATASTTIEQGGILNPTIANGGLQRLITKAQFFSANTSGTFLGSSLILDFNTSTSQFTSSTAPIWSTTLTTSTNPTLITTSTPNGVGTVVSNMIWNPGEYFHCTTNRAVSSTNGFCAVEYRVVQ